MEAKFAFISALRAWCWIPSSDRALLRYLQVTEVHTRLQHYKGGVFVFPTALMLARLVQHLLRLLRREVEDLRRRDREILRREELLENIISTIASYGLRKDRDSSASVSIGASPPERGAGR